MKKVPKSLKKFFNFFKVFQFVGNFFSTLRLFFSVSIVAALFKPLFTVHFRDNYAFLIIFFILLLVCEFCYTRSNSQQVMQTFFRNRDFLSPCTCTFVLILYLLNFCINPKLRLRLRLMGAVVECI